jgi:hypothetical protein
MAIGLAKISWIPNAGRGKHPVCQVHMHLSVSMRLARIAFSQSLAGVEGNLGGKRPIPVATGQ